MVTFSMRVWICEVRPYKMLKHLDENGKKIWEKDVKLMLEMFGFLDAARMGEKS